MGEDKSGRGEDTGVLDRGRRDSTEVFNLADCKAPVFVASLCVASALPNVFCCRKVSSGSRSEKKDDCKRRAVFSPCSDK